MTAMVRSTAQPRPWVMKAARGFGTVLFRVIFRLRVIGAEHVPARGPVILAGNHTGFLDGPLVFIVAPRRACFLVKSELYSGRLGRALDTLGQIPVNRGRPDRTALRRGIDVLAAGEPLGVFPEGTRGAGSLDSVQHGIAYIALKAGCPVVPVACFGSADALPKGRKLPRLRTSVDVVFGTPFHVHNDADPRSRRAVADAAEEIRVHLVDHLAASARLTGRGDREAAA